MITSASVPAMIISDKVREVLASSKAEECVIRLTCGQLTREEYNEVNKVLVALGGKWNRGARGHVFETAAAPILAAALGGQKIVSRKQDLQLFETPAALADEMAARLSVEGSILEPSAGNGALVDAVLRRSLENVVIHAWEIDERCVENMRRKYAGRDDVEIQHGEFLDRLHGPQFHAVLMNPPFSKGRDIQHVLHAWTLLLPRGVLAAITSPGWTFRADKKHSAFRTWVKSLGDRAEVTELPAGTFAKSGTQVAARLLVIRKP